MELYPLKFRPLPREMIWGGNKLRNHYGKSFPDSKMIGESWEISAVSGNISVVSEGRLKGSNLQELIEVYMDDLVGKSVYNRFGNEFPILVKLIDANEPLSIQVHPGDELAARRHNANGKTELWYILEAGTGSELITGFNSEVSAALFIDRVKNGRLKEILNVEKVSAGDAFFIPAGRVHAIGKGIVLAEIQQTSDITYRIYDWDRLDENGAPRELHLDLAMDAIDFGFYNDYRTVADRRQNVPVPLADCSYFTASLIQVEGTLPRDYSQIDSFVIYICTKGELVINSGQDPVTLAKGESALIPACIPEVNIFCRTGSELLEVYVR